MCVLLFVVFNGCSSSIKEINRLIWKRMSNIYYWEKLTFPKFEEMNYPWRAKRYKVFSGQHIYWHYRLQLPFVYKAVSRISFKLFCSGDKRLLSEFLRKWGWQHFPKYLGWNLKFQKTVTRFCRWKSND